MAQPLDLGASTHPTAPPLATVRATIEPLLQRIRLGEGGLIGMATWAAAWESRDWMTTASVFVLSAALLMSVYLFNDVSDRLIDAYNPKKIAHHRAPLLLRPGLFIGLSLAVHLVVCLASWWLLGPFAGTCAASLLLLNPLYSGFAKGIPGVDVALVGVMGAAVIGLATSSWSLLLLSAAMTAISHAFQTRVDVQADLAAGVRNSGTAPEPLRSLIWLALTVAFAATAYDRLGVWWAASASVPYLLLSRSREVNRAWACGRVYFAVVWIAATVR